MQMSVLNFSAIPHLTVKTAATPHSVFKYGVVNWFGFVEFVFVARVVGDSSVNGYRELFDNVGRMV